MSNAPDERIEFARMSLPSPRSLTVTLVLLLTALFLSPLTTPLDWNGHFVEVRRDLCGKVPLATPGSPDPWGNQYLSSGGTTYSSGPNGYDEGSGGDDISCDTPSPRRPFGTISYVLLAACVLCFVALIWRVLSRGGRRAATNLGG